MTAVPEPLALYEAKAIAELGDANALAGVAEGGWSGDPLGAVVLVVSGAATGRAGDDLLPADLGEAVGKALAALGFEEGSTFVIASRPGEAGPDALADRLRLALEAVDAPLVLALDPLAADDLAAAFCLPGLEPGKPTRAAGRVIGNTGDFAASLADAHAKGRVWAAMRSVAAAAGHRTQTKRPTGASQ